MVPTKEFGQTLAGNIDCNHRHNHQSYSISNRAGLKEEDFLQGFLEFKLRINRISAAVGQYSPDFSEVKL